MRVCVYVCTYIYIYREREVGGEIPKDPETIVIV